ncbi:MAG: MATE family efflux transporter [Firmicutes bacterium]|nr:MATE family efflux transporter [Bacillota bacterium]
MEKSMQQNKLAVMPIPKLLFSMSLPAMFSMLIMALYNIVDSMFVSRLGEDALTAVTLVFPIQMLVVAVSVGTGVGLSSLISRRLGQQRQKEADSAASHGIFLAVCSWLVFALFGLIGTKPFIGAFATSEYLFKAGCQYCMIITIGSLFSFIQVAAEKTMQSTGNMVYPMIGNITGCVTNIILDPIMIFGYFGCPALGVAGAALATIIGQFFGMAVNLFFLFAKKQPVHIHLKGFRPDMDSIKNIYSVGFPSIVMQAIGSVMNLGMNAILISFSGAAVAVFGIYFKLQSFIFMPVFGLNQGLMPILGFNFGARNRQRMMHALKLGIISAAIIMGVGLIIFQTAPKTLLGIFDPSEEMITIGVRALRTISLCFLPAAVGIMTGTLFQATNHGFLSLLVSLLRQLILILPLAIILSKIGGLELVWFAFPLAETFSLMASLVFTKWIYTHQVKPLDDPINEPIL